MVPFPLQTARIATTLRDARLACEAGVIAVGLDPRRRNDGGPRARHAWTTKVGWRGRTEGNSEASLLLRKWSRQSERRCDRTSPRVRVMIFADTLEKRIGELVPYPVNWAMESGQLYIRRDAYFNASWASRIQLYSWRQPGVG